MSVSTEILARKYLNPVAGTPINVDYPAFDQNHVRVLYGLAGYEAVLDTDFTVTLNVVDYSDFTITPLASLRTKIDAMIAADATESDQIVVRRDMPMTTDMTPTLARLREQIALEFDRTALRLQQVQEINARSLQVAETDVSGDSNVLPPMSANLGIKRNATNDGWVATTYDPDEAQTASETAQAAAEAAQALAEAARDDAQTAQAAAEAALDTFDDRYLGAKTVAPTLDNDGNPLQDGALYYNTTSDVMFVYDLGTTTWIDVGEVTSLSVTEFTNKTIDSDTNTVGADHTHIRVRNTSGGTLTKGTIVMATGYNAGEDRIEVSATATSASIAFCVLSQDLTNNANGLGVNTGVVNGVDTSAWAVGTKLYSNGSGGFTDTKPAYPYQTCGFVLRSHATVGRLFVEFTDQIEAQGGAPHGQCKLALNGANLELVPYNGNSLLIDGTAETVPASTTLAATGLTPGTLYYIYAYMNAGTLTLEASATGHSTHTDGVEIKTGDSTRTLVGMARPVTGPAWADTVAQRFVRSWFNRAGTHGSAVLTADRSSTSTSFVEIHTEIRNEFILWAGEAVSASCVGTVWESSAGVKSRVAIGFDGTAEPGHASQQKASSTYRGGTYPTAYKSGLSEGYHYATVMVDTNGTVYLGGGTVIADDVTQLTTRLG